MKQNDLFHPRIFNDQEWAEGYYKRNKGSIEKIGKRFVKLLKKAVLLRGLFWMSDVDLHLFLLK